MRTVTIDFETYWTQEYSLAKMSFMEYIMDERFEVISVAISEGGADTKVVFGQDEVRIMLQSMDWSTIACIAHNGNEFDFPVLVWVFDCHPKLFIDTLAMSRPRHQSTVGGSLAKLSTQYNLPPKDASILTSTRGKRYIDLDLTEMRDMAVYNKGDTNNTYALFKEFAKVTPVAEFMYMDMTARMICYPKFMCDSSLLQSTMAEVKQEKEKLLEALAHKMNCLDTDEVRVNLASAPKFAEVLRMLDVDPPVKISKTTGLTTYAFAKTDEEFMALAEHDDPHVQLAVSARLGIKSTLLETRLAKMMKCAEVMRGYMPVPLAYHSATTGRWGGRVWNPQNLPRIPRDKTGAIVHKLTNALRMSLRAPPGYKVVVSDLSAIELRVNHYLWDVPSTKQLYDNDPKADLYKTFASTLFNIKEQDVTKDQRQLAKVAQLGLGFGAGSVTFKKVAKQMGGIALTDQEASNVVNVWRNTYRPIVDGWQACRIAVEAMHGGGTYWPDPRGLVAARGGSVWGGQLLLPSKRTLYYPNMRYEEQDGKTQIVYGDGNNKSKVYSGLLDENIVQAIARDVICEQARTIQARTGHYPALMVHDELVYVVPEEEAEDHLAIVNSIMRSPPSWLPGIVLWSEGDIADTYGEAK